MKKTTALCLAISLSLGTSGIARADWGYHGNHRPGGYEYRHYQNHDYGDRRRANWVGPAAILAITGLAIGAAAYSQANAAPVYIAPPRPMPPPPSENWYYCDSSGQYYPYVRNCPEGWQAVMPPR
jgi:hypothetical protein